MAPLLALATLKISSPLSILSTAKRFPQICPTFRSAVRRLIARQGADTISAPCLPTISRRALLASLCMASFSSPRSGSALDLERSLRQWRWGGVEPNILSSPTGTSTGVPVHAGDSTALGPRLIDFAPGRASVRRWDICRTAGEKVRRGMDQEANSNVGASCASKNSWTGARISAGRQDR